MVYLINSSTTNKKALLMQLNTSLLHLVRGFEPGYNHDSTSKIFKFKYKSHNCAYNLWKFAVDYSEIHVVFFTVDIF